MKRLVCVLLALLLLPLPSMAELEMKVANSTITFPDFDGMKGWFRITSRWTIVHRGNLDEHMSLLLKRGDTEEQIRTRFNEDTLLFEAYKTGFPEDACIRMERFVDDVSRDIWHLRHLSTAERKAFLQRVEDGQVLAKYDTNTASYKGTGGKSYIDCSFTTYPPIHESGRMAINYINGQAYVLSYVVHGRMAGRTRLRTHKENQIIEDHTPFWSLSFSSKLLPKMPDFALDAPFPVQADVGELTVSGTVTKGSSIRAMLGTQTIDGAVDGQGRFRLTLPLASEGDHQVVFTVSCKGKTDREETFSVNASAIRTPLQLREFPEETIPVGEQRIAGFSKPGAKITLQLDQQPDIVLTADEQGAFSHTFDFAQEQGHLLRVIAVADGREATIQDLYFYSAHGTLEDSIDAFEKELTTHSLAEIAKDPAAYAGERVKLSVRIKDVAVTDTGLTILANHNPSNTRQDKTPLCLTVYGYARDQMQENMIVTIYGTVTGPREIDGTVRPEILVQYGTYLTGT